MIGGKTMGKEFRDYQLTEEEMKFLALIRDPISRPILLARLERLGLLSAFQEIESETI